ncbi:MAG: peptidoglycan endopeptidase [Actinobacteria bacterium]|nr:peptidoglycan endopeptidase [Actinomycetota bacterium]NDE53274.1 peptidoglycan endopeptidase [Actinomycetota bacterium]
MIALSLSSLLVLSLTPALANPPKPTIAQIEAAKKAEAEKKKAADAAAARLNKANLTLRQLTAVATKARQKYEAAKRELAVAVKEAQAAAAAYNAAVSEVKAAHDAIGRLAANAYIMGGGFTDLDALLHSDGPQDLMDRLSTLNNLGEQNTTALFRFKAAEQVAKEAKKAADAAKLAQEVATKKVEATKIEADAARSAQQKEVDKLQKIQDQILKELLAARKTRVTLEQQRQLALLEEANANIADNTAIYTKIWPDIGFKGRSTSRSTPEMRAKAVEFAKKQVLARKPYVWGSEGPSTFDCSGLVYAAYRSAGLGWPNWDRLNSSLYFSFTKHVPISQLEPGDLLFYSYKGTVNSIHHISIYAGNGMMWEANSKGKGLLFSNIYSIKGLMPYGGRV